MSLWEHIKGVFGARRPEVQITDDVIWMNDRARFEGVARAVGDRLRAGRLVIATAQFPRTFDALTGILEREGHEPEPISGRTARSDLLRLANSRDGGRLIAVLADCLHPEEPTTAEDTVDPIEVIVAERHFLRARDEAIVGFARGLGRRARVSFHLALTDPLMEQFAGAWVRQVLTQLGLKESEAIENRMVSRRIRDAQRKLAAGIGGELGADSPEEWLRNNLPLRDTR